MSKEPFYAQGLRFSCTRCSACCRYEAGFVWLSENDVGRLAQELKIDYNALIERYCRWVPAVGGGERLSLREKGNFDCIFWDSGCTVYASRPEQCVSFPFWDSLMSSRRAWESTDCPGAGKGALHSREEIEAHLAKRRAEPVATRKN